MSTFYRCINNNYRIIVFLFFAVLLCIGIVAFDDYGVSCDEPALREMGEASLNFIVYQDQRLFNMNPADLHHGAIFEILLSSIEKLTGISNISRTTYLMRHFITFLMFFIGSWFFYLLCKRKFRSWKYGLFGSLCLFCSPRIFAHSFYNSKDLVFLSLFIISVFTLVNFLNKKTIRNAIFHALTSALSIDVRIMGIFIIFLTLLLFGIEYLPFIKKKTNFKKDIISVGIYVGISFLFIVVLWPLLWEEPIKWLIEILHQTLNFPWNDSVLYFGNYINASDLPWHYIPVWIIITTPLLYIIFFIIGCFCEVPILSRGIKQYLLENRGNLIYFLWFFIPLLSFIVLTPVMYDAWRQMFFIYPAFLIIGLIGLDSLNKILVDNVHSKIRIHIVNPLLISVIIFSIGSISFFMIKNHPHQYVYFNFFADKNSGGIKQKFEMDYWGLSYRQAIEYILKNDPDDKINILVANAPGFINSLIFSPEDQKRLVYVNSFNNAEYFLSNFRWHKENYSMENEYYSIRVGKNKIMVVYKISSRDKKRFSKN